MAPTRTPRPERESAPDGTDAQLTSPELIAARQRHFDRLRVLNSGRAPVQPFVLWGVEGTGRADPYREPEQWVAESLADLSPRADALLDPAVFRPPVVEFGPYGVHFVDRILGADVFELGEEGNWQARVLSTPIGQLVMPDLDSDQTWGLAKRVARAFVSSGATVPLFGMPTIASALNVAVNLYGQEFLADMLDKPRAVRHDLVIINDLLCRMHRWYLKHVPIAQLQPVVAAYRTQPPGRGQLCGCTTQLLSSELYRDFIAPLDAELLSVYPHGGMIHLCGTHTQHISVWREMECLRAIQISDRAAEDLEVYFNELRNDQVIYVNAFDRMPVERIMAVTGGRRVVIVADLRGGVAP